MVTAERLARRGRLHPDAGVARLTVMWANVVLSADAKYPAEASFLPLFIRSALTEILTLGLWGDFRFQQALLERHPRSLSVKPRRKIEGGFAGGTRRWPRRRGCGS